MRPFKAIFKAIDYVRDNRIGERIYDAFLAPGTYIPQETRTDPVTGQEVIVQEEVVEGQGALRSRTIRWAIAGVTGSISAISLQLKSGNIDIETFLLSVGTLVTSVGTIWGHVRSWMPVRGAETPVPRIPPPISQ